MIQFSCCLKKDLLEVFRTRKTILFNGLLISITIMVFVATMFFPTLITTLSQKAPELIADGTVLLNLLNRIFPQTTKENMGIWASDVVMFFTIAISFVCCNLLREEIYSGKWILVKTAGYRCNDLLISKMLVYGVYTSGLTFVGYNVYYALIRTVIEDNFNMGACFVNSVILGLVIFFITSMSISISILYRNHVMAMITVLFAVLAAPDILSLFSFGRWLPTYLLTYVYTSSNEIEPLLVPLVGLVLMQIIVYRISINRIDGIEADR